MYAKIALGNVRRSFRDFSIFFLTLAFGVCIFYAFGSIKDQTAVINLMQSQSEMVDVLVDVLEGVSAFVAVILGFLVVFANRFLIRRRKREFGIYLTLGMGTRQVSTIIVMETLVVGVVALAVGMLLGIALSQLMMYVTANLFAATIKGFVFVFSSSACVTTVACFAAIFVVSLVFNVTTVTRYKLIDLINAERVSEQVKVRSLPLSVALFLASLALIGVAYQTLLEHGMLESGPWFGLATALVTVGTLLFFFSISGFLVSLAQRSKKLYFSGLNMFVVRQFNSRVNTAWLSITLVCAMLFLAVCGVCTGFSVATGLNSTLERASTYDASIFTYPTGLSADNTPTEKAVAYDFDMAAAMADDVEGWDEMVSQTAQVNTYGDRSSATETPQLTLSWFLERTKYEGSNSALTVQLLSGNSSLNIAFVKESEYNALLELKGEEPIDLGENGCLLWSDIESLEGFWKAAAEQNPTIEVWGRELTFVSTDPVDTPIYDSANISTVSGAIIVPDDVIPADEPPTTSALNVMYAGERSEVEPRFVDAVNAAYEDEIGRQTSGVFSWPTWRLDTGAQILESSKSLTITVSYLAIYIGFVLLVSCAAVLALQQLSEAADNVGRYRVLLELGAERRLVRRALFTQIGIYFLFPLVVAVAHAAVALAVVNDIVALIVGYQIGTALLITVGFVVLLYGGYFLVTYLTSRGIVLRSSAQA